MADTTIETTTKVPFSWITETRCVVAPVTGVAYAFSVTADNDLQYHKLSSGSFASPVDVNTATVVKFGIWYDKWTRNHTGDRVALAFTESGADDVLFNALDLADDTLDGETTIFAGATSLGVSHPDSGKLGIVRAEGGNLYCYADIDGGTEKGFFRSTNNGVTWTSRNAGFYEVTTDRMVLVPGSDADLNDVWMVYFDESAGELTLKVYDNSADSWSESAAILTSLNTSIHAELFPLDAVQRHSDGHVIAVVREHVFSADSDLIVVDITSKTTFSTLAPVKTSIQKWLNPRVFINQQNDDIYVGYMGDDDETDAIFATMGVYYKKSTNGGTSWGSQIAMSVNAEDDYRMLSLPNCITAEGGMFLPVWGNIDLSDYMCNLDNAISFGVSGQSVGEMQASLQPPVVMAPIPAQVVGY